MTDRRPDRIQSIACCIVVAWMATIGAGRALAHPLLQGSLNVTVASDHVSVIARVSQEEVAVTNTATTPDAPPGPWAATGSAAYEQHAAYMASHLHVIADGGELPGGVAKVDMPDDPAKSSSQATYELLYPLPPGVHPATIDLREDILSEVHFAPGAAWQVSYVVTMGAQGKPSVEGLLLTADKLIHFDCNADAQLSRESIFAAYFAHGVKHILGQNYFFGKDAGIDHLLFITALVLAATSLWDLIKVVSAFTIAHTLTLTLAALKLVHVPEHVVEPLISLSIVFVAVQNVFWPKSSRGAVRLAAAFFFGLFHGLGFAGGLLDAMQEMHGTTVFLAIIAFSIGVEVGHQLVVLPLFATLKLVRYTRENPTAKERFSMAVQRVGSAGISVAGLFYLFVALRPNFESFLRN